MIELQPTVALGTLIHLVVLIVALVGVYWKTRELIFSLHNQMIQRIAGVEAQVTMMYEWWRDYVKQRSGEHHDE